MIKKRSRQELYDKFRQGSIPSGADFADFIRSQVNIIDDGLDISDDPDEPLNIRARGEDENFLDLSNLNNEKRWRISGLSEDPSREGINLKADDRSHLYIERDSGLVGIDTDQPEAKLHIKQVSAKDAFRIDDEGNDSSPFVVTSEGKVGIGIGRDTDRPSAHLHVNNPGANDTVRVTNNERAESHLVINNRGNIGIGYDTPNQDAKLSVAGAVTIGSNTIDPGDNGLYVRGDVKIDGKITFAEGAEGSIQLNSLLKARGEDVVIHDNVRILGDPTPENPGSVGNLYVEGDTTLGTFKGSDTNDNEVIVNGSIVSGYDPEDLSGDFQNELVINRYLKVDRDSKIVTLEKDLKATAGTINALDTLNIDKDLKFSSSSLNVNKIVSEINNNDNQALPTEGAVINYVRNNTIPIGSVVIWATPEIPVDWLECNGAYLYSSEYPQLYDVIKTTYGGDSTRFYIPDYRGYFLRGWSHDTDRDPDGASRTNRGDGTTGDVVGTRQDDMFGSHYHNFVESIRSDRGGSHEGMDNDSNGHFNYRTAYAGGNETRPKNVNVIFIIKWR